MQNSETEHPMGGELFTLCAIFHAVLHRKVKKKDIEFINRAHRGYPKAYVLYAERLDWWIAKGILIKICENKFSP